MKSFQVRFIESFIIEKNGCWTWQKLLNKEGYGRFNLKSRHYLAHRISLFLLKGIPFKTKKQCDHLCRNRACVNPDHLEMVSAKINNIRSRSLSALNILKTHCKRGHEFTKENTKKYRGSRFCRACLKAYMYARWRSLSKNERHQLRLKRRVDYAKK